METEVTRSESFSVSENSSEVLKNTDFIKNTAGIDARTLICDDESLFRFLRNWWCSYYNRPYKDPILLTYSLEELVYEFFDIIERKKAKEEEAKAESDKIELGKEQENSDWADRMEAEEARELASLKHSEEKVSEAVSNIIEQGKQEFGDDFGEDLNLSFED